MTDPIASDRIAADPVSTYADFFRSASPRRQAATGASHRRYEALIDRILTIAIDNPFAQIGDRQGTTTASGWGCETTEQRRVALSSWSNPELVEFRSTLACALSVEDVNDLGRTTGQAERLRSVTPHRLFLAIVSTLAGAKVESPADLLRPFTHQNGPQAAYTAFCNRLARNGVEAFMHEMCTRLIEQLGVQTLTPDSETAVARFADIMIQDGSSFAIKKTLKAVFPGRFTTIQPAAVEIHARYDGFADEVRVIHLAPDADARRQFLPDPATLTGRLLLADRGYPGVPYFEAVADEGVAFIVRLTRSYDPRVGTAWIDGRRLVLPTQRRLSRVLADHAGCHADLDVEFVRGRRVARFRVVVVPGRDETMTRLCTNLPRTPFSAPLVAQLSRFRWQIELCVKEWKSCANLHKCDTANPHIAAGLIWAGLCAAILKRVLAHAAQRVGDGTAISTRRVAMCAHHILTDLVSALPRGVGLLVALRRGSLTCSPMHDAARTSLASIGRAACGPGWPLQEVPK